MVVSRDGEFPALFPVSDLDRAAKEPRGGFIVRGRGLEGRPKVTLARNDYWDPAGLNGSDAAEVDLLIGLLVDEPVGEGRAEDGRLMNVAWLGQNAAPATKTEIATIGA